MSKDDFTAAVQTLVDQEVVPFVNQFGMRRINETVVISALVATAVALSKAMGAEKEAFLHLAEDYWAAVEGGSVERLGIPQKDGLPS